MNMWYLYSQGKIGQPWTAIPKITEYHNQITCHQRTPTHQKSPFLTKRSSLTSFCPTWSSLWVLSAPTILFLFCYQVVKSKSFSSTWPRKSSLFFHPNFCKLLACGNFYCPLPNLFPLWSHSLFSPTPEGWSLSVGRTCSQNTGTPRSLPFRPDKGGLLSSSSLHPDLLEEDPGLADSGLSF